MRWKLFPALAVALGALSLQSVASADGTIQGARYTSGRAAAMADAFIPLADDAGTALFYNPAGLAQIRGTHFEPGNFQIQLNNDYVSAFDQNFYKMPSLSAYAPTLSKNTGLFPGAGFALFPNFESRGFGMGILYSASVAAQSDGTTIHYRSHYQFIPTAGFGLRLFSGRLRFGYSIQWVNQSEGDVFVSANSDPLGYNQFLHQGSTISHNVGVTTTMPMAYLPTFSAVARNLFTAKYGTYTVTPLAVNAASTSPPDEPMTIDGSFSVQPKIGHGGTFNFVIEDRDILNKCGLPLLTRMTMGIEFNVKNAFYLRGGYGSLYPAAGLGMRSPRAEFSLSWYSEEIGNSSVRVRDARYILHYQIRAF